MRAVGSLPCRLPCPHERHGCRDLMVVCRSGPQGGSQRNRPARRVMARSFVAVGLAAAVLAAPTTLVATAAGPASISAVVSPPAAAPGVVALRPQADPPAPVAAKLPVRAEPDGAAVALDVSFFGQADGTRHPLVLLAHGFGGSKDSVAGQAAELQQRGYVVATWSARGHGRSGGKIHLDDPGYEVNDAKALVDLAAKRPDVELDGPGDPRFRGSGRIVRRRARADGWPASTPGWMPWCRRSRGTTWRRRSSHQSALAAAPTTAAGRDPIDVAGPFKQVWASTFFLSARGAGSAGGVDAGSAAGSTAPTDGTDAGQAPAATAVAGADSSNDAASGQASGPASGQTIEASSCGPLRHGPVPSLPQGLRLRGGQPRAVDPAARPQPETEPRPG